MSNIVSPQFRTFLYIILILISANYKSAKGQALELETLGPSVKWRQIKTEHFKILYPENYESEANRTANILETIHEPGSRSLGKKPKRFSILLQNKNAIANGFVTVLPRRSEFFTTAPQNYNFIGNANWMEFLATHEYRHMVQFNKAYTGIGKVLYWLFGEYGLGLSAGFGAPPWFWEGDAVGIETSLTNSGRGRIPDFTRVYKANLLERGRFNYYKQHHQSFKHFVPNHYRTGYFMTTYLKRKHGVDIWSKVVERSFKFPFIPFSFSNSMKAHTGKYLLDTYDDMSVELRELYSQQVSGIKPIGTPEPVVRRENETFTNYKYPYEIAGGRVIALKAGLSDISQFVSIDRSGNEEVVFIPGILNDPGLLSVRDNKILWTEYEFDTRWFKQSYSVIKLYDINLKKLKRLTKKSKYTAASLSHDGTKIVAIQNTEESKYALHILSSEDGSLIKKFDNPNNAFLSMPSFADSDNTVVLLKSTDSEKQIVSIDIESGDENELISSTTENFGHPVLFKNHLFYNTAFNGIDNIFALDLSSNRQYQVTSSIYGAYNPSVSLDGQHIYYNDHNRDGLDILKIRIDPTQWRPIDEVENLDFQYYKPMVEAENNETIFENMELRKYNSTRYNKIKGVINPFSWGLSALVLSNSMIIGVNSQDILSTTSISAGLIYSGNEGNWLKFGSVSYQGLYPIIDFSILDGTRSTDELIDDRIQRFDWQETSLSAGLRVPVLLTNSRYLRKMSFEAKTRRTTVTDYDNPVEDIAQPGNGNLNTLEYRFSYVRTLKRSKRDLFGKFGQTIQLDWRHTPIGGDYFSRLASVESNLFFPGLARHHSLRLRGTYQNEDKVNYRFSSPVTFTRGYGYASFDEYINWSVNYAAPIWYPDIHLGPFLNVQRIYSNVFYDHGTGKRSGELNREIRSFGIETSANFNIMRLNLLFDMGVRVSYLRSNVASLNNRRVVEIIFGRVTF